MDGECLCGEEGRIVVETVPWQRDICNNCGYPIPEMEAVDAGDQ